MRCEIAFTVMEVRRRCDHFPMCSEMIRVAWCIIPWIRKVNDIQAVETTNVASLLCANPFRVTEWSWSWLSPFGGVLHVTSLFAWGNYIKRTQYLGLGAWSYKKKSIMHFNTIHEKNHPKVEHNDSHNYPFKTLRFPEVIQILIAECVSSVNILTLETQRAWTHFQSPLLYKGQHNIQSATRAL